jgi:hypothetical protein
MKTVSYVMIGLLVMCCLEWFVVGGAAEYDPGVYEAQKQLQERGYDPGPIDGVMGSKTTAAIKQFQKDQKLPVTGTLDEETQERLGLHATGPNIRCAFAGTGATLSFGDKRLTFTCPPEDGNDVGLLGDIIPTEKGWEIEKAVIGHTDKGFAVQSAEMMVVMHIELIDRTRCSFAGTGATLAFSGKRLNFTCPPEGESDVGLLGDIIPTEKGWEIEKAVIGHTDEGFAVPSAEMAQIAAVVVEAATMK